MSYAPGLGTTLSLGGTAIAQLVSVTPPSMENPTADVTHLGSTWREFVATIPDGGEISLNIEYDSAQATHATLASNFAAGTSGTWVVTLADSGGTTIGFAGPITNFEWDEIVVDDVVRASVTVKISGAVTITP